ncbi:hypothetical protein MRB53_027115 [Persea americana]|uniref:Uncharacterized protein n=1 Tax=Persea americana TaxID=3435 RepID=A0ACC2LL49_PERAE|nr:hypothetical protein MRB53_027115 [Persea americana]
MHRRLSAAPGDIRHVNVVAAAHRHQEEENCHSMDTISPTSVVSQELARELLMAISEAIPDNVLASKLLPENSDNVNVIELKERKAAEKYRSELISISYIESPDCQTTQSSMENINT